MISLKGSFSTLVRTPSRSLVLVTIWLIWSRSLETTGMMSGMK